MSRALDRHIRDEESRKVSDAKFRRLAGIRLQIVDDCETCKKNRWEGPPHDASARCRSGFEAHCSCPACF